MSNKLKHTAIAFAVAQAFTTCAWAQTPDQGLPEVVITGSTLKSPRDPATISNLPFSNSYVSIDTRKMQDLAIRNTTDAFKFDASVGDAYNAVGYSEQFSIRGFALDNASNYRKDGIAIPADAQIPLENKARIDVLKGLAGLQAGVAAPGGVVNYALKRPTDTPLRSVTLEVRERGTLYGAADLGGRSDDRQFGYRVNAAYEHLRSYIEGADGKREFVSGAFDWRISPKALLQFDADYQHKSQISAPGYQLIRNEVLPVNVSPKALLNAQPWTKPVDTISTNIGLRFEYEISDGWQFSASMNKHYFERDDYTAFPYGCSNEGNGYYPGYCSNGDYDVYDYQSTGEKKAPFGADAAVRGKVMTGAVEHELALGMSVFRRRDSFGDYVYDYAGSSNIYSNAVVPPAVGNRTTGPVFERRAENERAVYINDAIALSSQLQLQAGLRHVRAERRESSGARYDAGFTLPNVALVFTPLKQWSVYGSLAHGLEHGGVAPLLLTNENDALAPSRSKQVEFGVKGEFDKDHSFTAALFQIRKGLEYARANADGSGTYVRNGEATHRGIELGAQGKWMPELAYTLSLLALDAKQDGTGQAEMDGKRTVNVPKLKSVATLEYTVAGGVKVNGAWQYVGDKAFDGANLTIVPAYSVFDFGVSYALRAGGAAVTIRGGVYNAFDKFYWRDVTPALGGYLFPGAPRTMKLSAQFDF